MTLAALAVARRRACPTTRRWSPSAATGAASCSRIPTSTSSSSCRTDGADGDRADCARPPSASSPTAGTLAWKSARACARSTNAWRWRSSDVTVQTALLEARYPGGRAAASSRPSRRASAAAMDPKVVPACQDARDAAAPPEVREHALLARAELQGKPRRPARPADGDLGGTCRRPRPHLAAARRQRPHHAVRGAPAAAQRGHAEADPGPPARHRRPAARTGSCSTCRPPSPRASATARRMVSALPSGSCAATTGPPRR